MENFFNWMSKPLDEDEVTTWFNINNMIPEKIELYNDFFMSLYLIVSNTYLGSGVEETKIVFSEDDKKNHYNWCWNTLIENFKKENIFFNYEGKHKEYFWEFLKDTFYNQKDQKIIENIPNFIEETFDLNKRFAKSDLDILTQIYKLLEKEIRSENLDF